MNKEEEGAKNSATKADFKKDEFYYRVYEPFFELWNIVSVPVLLSERHNLAIQMTENICREVHHFRERLGFKNDELNDDQELVRTVCNSSKHARFKDIGRHPNDISLTHAYRYEVREKRFRFIRIEIMGDSYKYASERIIPAMVNAANELIRRVFDYETFPKLGFPSGKENRWSEAADIFQATVLLPHPNLEAVHRNLGGTASSNIQCVRIRPDAIEELFDPELVSFAVLHETAPVARHIYSQKY